MAGSTARRRTRLLPCLGALLAVCGLVLLTAYAADLAAPVNAAGGSETQAWAAQEMTDPGSLVSPRDGEMAAPALAERGRVEADRDAQRLPAAIGAASGRTPPLATPTATAGPLLPSGRFHGDGAWYGADVRATHLDLRQELVELEAAARRQPGSPAFDGVLAWPGSVNHGPR
jgi:hypothetical protein